MACVFRAVDLESGEQAVLKVPHEHLECDVVFYDRFRREEEIGRRLDHPGIVRVLGPAEKTRLYLAMEHVPGSSLRALLNAAGPLPSDRALSIARQLCKVASYLHDQGVVHRDLKPENVLLMPPGDAVKLIDFGIAFLQSARRLTWAGLSGVLGTPDYMAPEQIQGRRGDARTDVYAIGTILYEMLTGHLPYEAPTVVALMHAKTHRDPTRASRYHPRLDPGLEAILARAIAPKRGDRYASAAEMLADLEDPRRANGRSVERGRAKPAPVRRGRHIIATSLLIGALMASGAVLGGVLGRQPTAARRTGTPSGSQRP